MRPPLPIARPGIATGLDAAAFAALARGLSGSELWSLLLAVAEARASRRSAADLMRQWTQDRFVAPSALDQRTLIALDAELFAAAHEFEAIELSPLAPLGVCSSVAPTSQNRIIATMRGTEVVSDPTNAMALECARRLRADPQAMVRLATSHRCVRAQPVPPGPGFAAHFRLFALASAAHERADHGFAVEAIAGHIATHLRALERLEARGYAFGRRAVRLLAAPARAHLMARVEPLIAAALGDAMLEHGRLDSSYYDGLRFMIDAGDRGPLPLIDGGAFDWLQQLASNRKLAVVASAMGSQLVALLFRP